LAGFAFGYAWKRYEGPTWVLGATIYIAWATLLWFHARITWWLLVPLAGYVVAWHSSLQHETIHAMVHVPRRVRTALASPPLGLWMPYAVYRRDHHRHHNVRHLTDPAEDPESYYHTEEAWSSYPGWLRAVYHLNATLLGRLTIGPGVQLWRLRERECARIRAGDRSNVRDWALHTAGVALLLGGIDFVTHLPWWQYLLFFAYPGLSFAMLRSFVEHRASERSGERTAIVESRWPLALLYLNNNLHLVHHLHPSLAWYEIPKVWRRERDALLKHNGSFHFSGYSQIARRWLCRPAFSPVQPRQSHRPASASTFSLRRRSQVVRQETANL
jgi:fatty acid desaturase